MSFSKEYEQRKMRADALIASLCERITAPAPLDEAMRYSLAAGGKRLRPILVLEAYSLFSEQDSRAVELVACAVECVHTYSLIHDDLPCMDNDDFRRGKPTSHKVFGEAVAVLAGDALLNLAYELLYEAAELDPRAVLAGKAIADAIGAKGLIAGQILDISEGRPTAALMRSIYQHKTADLISAALLAGGMMGGATDDELAALKEYGDNFGYSFQIGDDILDYKDKNETEKNFVAMYGMTVARSTLAESASAAVTQLGKFSVDSSFLKNLALLSLNRKV